MFDPVKLAEVIRKEVCRDDLRKYYRFRPSRFYGGIATADCVGCCLKCIFCWAWKVVSRPAGYGDFYTPEDVAEKLMKIAEERHLKQIRISGNEPTLCRKHLMKVLELINGRYLFILETNGILMGADEGYAKDLSGFKNLHVRVSLKGTCEDEFSRLTGTLPDGFGLQLKALENLVRHGVRCHPACMISFSPPENIEALRVRLKTIHPYYTAYRPGNIPPEQI